MQGEYMDTFKVILIIVAFWVGITMLRRFVRKGANAAAKALNKNVFFKSEYADGEKLVKETLTFECSASLLNIKNELTAHIATEEVIPAIKGVLYKLSESPTQIMYAYGNKLNTQMFTASLSLSNNGTTTHGVFEFRKWQISDGMIPQREIMSQLRDHVYAAFTAADPAVKVFGTPNTSDNVVATDPSTQESGEAPSNSESATIASHEIKQEESINFCSYCGSKVDQTVGECPSCGMALK